MGEFHYWLNYSLWSSLLKEMKVGTTCASCVSCVAHVVAFAATPVAGTSFVATTAAAMGWKAQVNVQSSLLAWEPLVPLL